MGGPITELRFNTFLPFWSKLLDALAPTFPPSRTPPTLRSAILDRDRPVTLPLSHSLSCVPSPRARSNEDASLRPGATSQ